MHIAKLCALFLVLLSTFCETFASNDISRHGRRRRALTSSTGAATNGELTAGHPSRGAIFDPNDEGTHDDNYLLDEPIINADLPESKFDTDSEFIMGEINDECNLKGNYSLRYVAKEKFSSGKKYKKIKASSLHDCGAVCAKKQSKCGTFNWDSKSNKCDMFTDTDIGRKRNKDKSAFAAYLVCME